MDQFECYVNHLLTVDQFCDLYRRSGIRRPFDDRDRMARMLANSNLVVSAWIGKDVVGVARAFADYGWACYLSDLAVDRAFQRRGVGKLLIQAVQREIGPCCSLVLISAPGAVDYYPKVGFEPLSNGYVIRRTKP